MLLPYLYGTQLVEYFIQFATYLQQNLYFIPYSVVINCDIHLKILLRDIIINFTVTWNEKYLLKNNKLFARFLRFILKFRKFSKLR